MEGFGQHAAISQPGYPYTQDFMDIGVYSGDHFNHQHNLPQLQRLSSTYNITRYQEPNADPYGWLDGSVINPSSFNGNSFRYLPSFYVNSQVLTPTKCEELKAPYLLNVNQDGDLGEMGRPPYSYSELIAMAFLNSTKTILNFRQICNYVTKTFPFYEINQTFWQTALAHSLFLNDCFVMVGKNYSDLETGDYWILNPNCEQIFENGKFQRKPDHTSKEEPLRSDSAARFSESKVDASSALDTSTTLDDILDVINAMSDGASTQLTENFSPSEL